MISFCMLSKMPEYLLFPLDSAVGIQVFLDVNITLRDGVKSGLLDVTGLPTQEQGLDKHHRTP